MTQSDIINNNFSKTFECIKCSNAYDTGAVLSEEKLFKQISERRHSTFDLSKFTVVGSPTITDNGIVSGFSSSNYLTIPKLSSLVGSANSWELDMQFTTPNDITSSRVGWLLEGNTNWCNLIRVGGDDTNYTGIQVSLTSTGSSYDIASYKQVVNVTANTTYWLKLIFTGTEYLCKYSTNETDFTTVNIATSSLKISDNSTLLNIGVAKNTENPFRGSIDLKQFSITVDGKEVFSGNKTGIDVINDIEIPYTLSKTGSKIVDVAYRDRVIDLYEQEGQAGYYTIDETNKNFTLPMGEIYGMIGNSSSAGGSGLEVCDIGIALYVDETKGLRRYLNGQIVDINANTQAFLNRLKQITTLHPSLLCTEEEWQTAKTMSAFGQVGKFVFNYSGGDIISVRLPRVVNVQGLFDLQNLGLTVEAGLPNVTSSWYSYAYSNGSPTGVVTSNITTQNTVQNGGGPNYNFVKFSSDASRSSSIYGNSTTVQPEAIQYPYFIQIATGAETQNNIVNEIELNNPYSLFDSKYSDHELNNLSWLKSEGQWNAKAVYPTAYDKLLKVYNGTETVEGLSVKLSTETYTDYDFVLNTADETFRLPLKNHSADDGNANLKLYYYVGETVQNANLIDAGRIGEQLADKVNMLQAAHASMPSDKYIDLTLGASGSTYTAPADGYFIILMNAVNNTNMGLGLASGVGRVGFTMFIPATNNVAGNNFGNYIPVKKGNTVNLFYFGTTSAFRFRFVYAIGSEPQPNI